MTSCRSYTWKQDNLQKNFTKYTVRSRGARKYRCVNSNEYSRSTATDLVTCRELLVVCCVFIWDVFRTPAYRPPPLPDTAATNYHQMQYTKIEVSRYFRAECIHCLAKKITFNNLVLLLAELFHNIWIVRHCDFIPDVPGSSEITAAGQSGLATTTLPPPRPPKKDV